MKTDSTGNASGESLGTGVSFLTVSSFVFLLTGYAVNVVLARVLGPGGYGTFGVILALVTAVNLIQTQGLPQAVSRFVSRHPDQEDAILKSSHDLGILLSVMLTALFYVSAGPLSVLLNDPALAPHIRLASFVFPLYGMFALYVGYWNGRRLFRKQAVMNVVYAAAKSGGMLILGVLYGIPGAVAGYVTAPLVPLLSGYRRPAGSTRFPYRPIIRFSAPLVLFGFLVNLQMNADLMLVKALGLADRVPGYYVAAQNVSLILFYGLQSFALVLFPGIARSTGLANDSRAQTVIAVSVRYILMALFPAISIIQAAGDRIVTLLYSDPYLPAARPLAVLSAGIGFLTLSTVLSYVLNASGKASRSIAISLAGLSVTVMTCLILIPRYGATGAAAGTLAGGAVSAILSSVAVRRQFRIPFPGMTLVKLTVSSAAIYVLGKVIVVPRLFLPVQLVALLAVYVLILRATGEFGTADLQRIRRMFRGGNTV